MKVFAHIFPLPVKKQLKICLEFSIGCMVTISTPVLLSLNQDIIQLIKMASREIPIAIHGPYHDLYPGSIDPFIRSVALRRYNQVLELTKSMEIKFITLHLNYLENIHGHHRVEWLSNASQTFSKLQYIDTPIHIENTKESDPDIFLSVLSNITRPNVGMCLDIGHVVAYSTRSLRVWIKKLSRYINELHIHECSPGRDIHEPLGSGLMDWNEIFCSLNSAGINISKVFLTLEPRTADELRQDLHYLSHELGYDIH